MKSRSIFGAALLAAVALCVPTARADKRGANVSSDDSGLLKNRFLAAYYAAMRPTDNDHAESLVDVMRSIEKDFGLELQTGDLIKPLEASSPRYKEMYEPGASKGIASYHPLEKAAMMRKEELQKKFLVDAINLSGICIPADAEYNARYVDFLEKQPWSDKLEHFTPVRYALYTRMYKRGCLTAKSFLARTKPLVPAMRRLMLSPDLEAGDAGSYVYLFAASDRLDQVPADLLRHYIDAQEQDGTWSNTSVGDPSVAAAQGAYVLITLLHRQQVEVTKLELFRAMGDKPPLPEPVPFRAKN